MRLLLLVLFVAALLQACGVPHSPDEFNSTPEAQFLRSTVDKLASHDFASIKSLLDERIHQPDTDDALQRLASMLPPGNPTKVEPVDWRFFKQTNLVKDGPTSRTARVAIEYTFAPQKWVVASATLSGEPGAFRILAFTLEPLPAPLSEIHALTFKDKGPIHYLFALLSAASLGVSLFAFVRCIRTQGLTRKWLWALLTLVGMVAFTLDWTNGTVSYQVFRFNLLGTGISRIGWLGPWSVSFTIPFGALIFLCAHWNSARSKQTEG